jgi:hypothetical protein
VWEEHGNENFFGKANSGDKIIMYKKIKIDTYSASLLSRNLDCTFPPLPVQSCPRDFTFFFLSKIHNPVIEMPTIDVGGASPGIRSIYVLVWSNQR